MEYKTTTDSSAETISLGRRLGEQLRGGEVLALVGALGSGKTHLIKGIVEGLGCEGGAEHVNSPTFVLVNEYQGRYEVYHIDAYRLDSAEQLEQIGFDDYCHSGSVVLIEWADKVESVLAGVKAIWVELSHAGPEKRFITIRDLPGYINL